MIVDLRDNPGGYVTAARTIASQFIAGGPLFWEESADGTQIATDASPGGIATDPGIRVMVLVNKGSASASEIVSGAMQDTKRGTLVGETTFGKGTVQQWVDLTDNSGGFRLTIAKWLTPAKHWIHTTGLTPDVAVAADGASTTPTGDPYIDAALKALGAPTAMEAWPRGSLRPRDGAADDHRALAHGHSRSAALATSCQVVGRHVRFDQPKGGDVQCQTVVRVVAPPRREHPPDGRPSGWAARNAFEGRFRQRSRPSCVRGPRPRHQQDIHDEEQPAMGESTIALNRKARHEYSIEDTFEAGLVLTGTEIKSIRAGHVSLQEAYARIERGEAWLVGAHIAPVRRRQPPQPRGEAVAEAAPPP